MIYQRVRNRGIRLGTLFARAAAKNTASLIHLDHDLDMAPEIGRRIPMRVAQDVVEDFSSRFWRMGLRTGDHLVIYKGNNFDITLAACAAARVGIVPVLLSPMLSAETVRILIRRLGRPYLLTDESKLSEQGLEGVGAEVAGIIAVGAVGTAAGATPFDDLRGPTTVPAVRVSTDHPTLITHTSGTTGVPKLAVHTGRTMEARYRPQSMVAYAVRRQETVAIHVSFVHSRIFTALPIAALHGHSVVMIRDDHPDEVADLLARTRPGLIEAHPNTFVEWEVLEHHPARPLSNVKVFSSTFDAIHPRTVETLLRCSSRRGAVFVQMYGQSEVGPIAGRLYGRRRGMREGRCVGRPFPLSTGVRVVPRTGDTVDRDHPGYIEVRSDGRIVTYFGEEARWEQQINDGWWRMGDVGFTGRWGCLHMQDREVDMVDGLASTLEVEDALLRALPQLQELVIVRSASGEPVPAVCVREGARIDDDEWARAVTAFPQLAPRVELSVDQMPTTSTTKVRRLELADRIAAGPRATAPVVHEIA